LRTSEAFAKTGQSILREEHTVKSYDVGSDHRLTLPALLRALHETAQQHAAGHGFGYSDLCKTGHAWALAALELELGVLPKGHSNYTVSTSVAKHGGPVVYRDYLAETDGGAFASGQTMWALINLDTRRADRPSDGLRNVL